MADNGPIFDASNPVSPLSIPSANTALLLCDYHKFIMSFLPAEKHKVLETADALRSWARSQNIKVIHCLIDTDVPIAPSNKMAGRMAQAQDAIAKLGPDATLAEVPTIAARPDEYKFWRPLGRISVLSSYGLTDFLQRNDIKSVIIAGVATSGCVIDSAKAASEAGFVVSVVEDACADRDDATHEFIMHKLLGRSGHVATQEELAKAWS